MGIQSSNNRVKTGTSSNDKSLAPPPISFSSVPAQPGTAGGSGVKTPVNSSRSKKIHGDGRVKQSRSKKKAGTLVQEGSPLPLLESPDIGASDSEAYDSVRSGHRHDVVWMEESSNSAGYQGAKDGRDGFGREKRASSSVGALEGGVSSVLPSEPDTPGNYPVSFVPLTGRFLHLVPKRRESAPGGPAGEIERPGKRRFSGGAPRKQTQKAQRKTFAATQPLDVEQEVGSGPVESMPNDSNKSTGVLQRRAKYSVPRALPTLSTFDMTSEMETADRLDRRIRAFKQFIEKYDGIDAFGVVRRSQHIFYEPSMIGTYQDLINYHQKMHLKAWYAAIHANHSRKQIAESPIPLSVTSQLRKRLPKVKRWGRYVGKYLHFGAPTGYVEEVLTQNSIDNFNRLYTYLKGVKPRAARHRGNDDIQSIDRRDREAGKFQAPTPRIRRIRAISLVPDEIFVQRERDNSTV